MRERKTVCLNTNWYPTPDNPFVGHFFREQAIAMQENYDFIVTHVREHLRVPFLIWMIRWFLKKLGIIKEVRKEYNIEEFQIDVYYPWELSLFGKLWPWITTRILKKEKTGVGRYSFPWFEMVRSYVLRKTFVKFEKKIDLLYGISAQNESSALAYISQELKIPYIVSEHGAFPWPGTSLLSREHDAIEQADAILAISQDKIRQILMQNIHVKKFYYVGNLVDETRFCIDRIPHDKKTFIIIAAHSFYKNYNLFVDIFNRLKQISEKEFKVMIVGYGANKGYATGIEEFEQQIKESLFAKNAELIPECPNEKIPNLLNRADAFVMTSIQEGMPVSALEAGCCGLPIFSTRCGGVEDYVTEEIGRIFDVMDAEAFANFLSRYLNGEIQFSSQRIREIIVEKYGRKAFSQRLDTVFMSVIDEKL